MRHLLIPALCGLSFVAGLALDHLPTPAVAGEVELQVEVRPAEWRGSLAALRADADGDVMRVAALEALEEADTELAQAEAIELLGWVGARGDLELLHGMVFEGETLGAAALKSMGRIGGPEAVDRLIEVLDSDETERHGDALLALGVSGDPRAFDALVSALDDRARSQSAAFGLALYGSPRAAAVLDRHFSSTQEDAWFTADALASFSVDQSPEARQALYRALRDGRTAQRRAALQALAHIGDDAVFDALANMLARGGARARGEAVSALGELKDPRAIPLLAHEARYGTSGTRSSAVWALGVIPVEDARDALIALIETGPSDVAGHACSGIGRLDAVSIDALVAASTERGVTVGYQARSRLYSEPWGKAGVPEAVLAMARAELDAPPQSNWSTGAPTFLLRNGSRGDREAVLRLLQEGDRGQRLDILYQAQQDGDLLSDAQVIAMMDDPDSSVRSAALDALMAQVVDPDVLEEVLIAQLRAGSGDMYIENALAQLGSGSAGRILMERVRSGTTEEGRRAMNAIVWNGDARQLEQLHELLEESEDPVLRQQIYQTVLWADVPNLEGFVDSALAEDDANVRGAAASALGRLGRPESRETLQGLMESESADVRRMSMEALLQLGGPDTEDLLVQSLDDPDLQWSAMNGLQNIGTHSAREQLRELALDPDRDDSVRTQALYAAASGGPDRMEILDAALDDDSDAVRQAAIQSLQQTGSTAAAERLGALLDEAESEQDGRAAAAALQGMGGGVAKRYEAEIGEWLTTEVALGSGDGAWGGDDYDFEGLSDTGFIID